MLDKKSLFYRRQILDILLKAKRGHIGSAFSIIEILRVLYEKILSYRPQDPEWQDRDRFILSKGHGCLALYTILAEHGFIDKEELYRFCAFDGILGGHPEHLNVPGVEVSTGSLGHGLSVACGIALAGKMDQKSYQVFALVGDGECNEGSIWEAALFAPKHKLNNLTVLVDYNKMQCYSSTMDVLNLEPLSDKWRAFGWEVVEVDGHNMQEIESRLKKVGSDSDKPTSIICHTIKGKGVRSLENNPKWHHKARATIEELQPLLEELI